MAVQKKDTEFEIIKDGEVSEVAEWFKSRNVLVTGATGFLGKIVVERILRVCPGKTVYLLLRPKKGKNLKERLDEFLNCQVFDGIRDNFPDRLSSVIAIKGDILQENLGIADSDRSLLIEQCNTIFHCAANVRFDQTLKGAVITNTLGTKKVLALAKDMKQLDVFVHVSTSYCHCDRDILEETSYPAPHDPEKIIDLVGWMDNDLQAKITPRLLGRLPNTYAYSKSLSEHLIKSHEGLFPIVLARPSIVVSSWKEPMPGWIENLNGPTGLIVGAGKGVIRSMLCQENYHADIMPVDVCANAIVALAWKAGVTKPKEIMVCNVTLSGSNPITWGETLAYGRKHVYDNPFTVTLWWPDGSIKTSRLFHYFCVILFHLIPAYFIDTMLVLFRKKPFMVKIQQRVSDGLQLLQYYTTKEWVFSNNVYRSIDGWLCPKDKKLLYTDMTTIDWNSFIRNYILGAREYCCKEDPNNIPRARSFLKKLYYLDQFVSIFFYGFLLWLVWSYSPMILGAVETIMSSTSILFTKGK